MRTIEVDVMYVQAKVEWVHLIRACNVVMNYTNYMLLRTITFYSKLQILNWVCEYKKILVDDSLSF